MAVKSRFVFLLPLAVVLILIAVFGKRLLDVAGGEDPRLLKSVLLDTPMPDMDLAALPGRFKTMPDDGLATADLKGQVSLVNVWGSWCVACLAEHPMLVEIEKSGAVPIHGIDWRDTPEAANAWLARHGDPYARIGLDPRSHTAIALGVTGAPESFLVDANGVIRYKYIGPITPEVWSSTLQPMIAQLEQEAAKP
ncbi:MAG: DsbE family thiol:disulfide interchange protein [Rhodobacteraceae bacterium]|nr:DsbE family thiol:disulfide interchange protein [Paracoccaceae bacterium]